MCLTNEWLKSLKSAPGFVKKTEIFPRFRFHSRKLTKCFDFTPFERCVKKKKSEIFKKYLVIADFSMYIVNVFHFFFLNLKDNLADSI